MRARLGPPQWRLLALALPALLVLAGLGVWQLQRAAWKTALIAEVEAGLAAPPRALEALGPAGTWAEFTPVTVTGRFDHARELHLVTIDARDGPGVRLITPLLLADGRALAVDRGFVPDRLRAPETRPGSRPEGMLTLSGWLRAPGTRGLFTPADDRRANAWFTRDPQAFAAHWGLALAGPMLLVLREDQAASWPRGGMALNLSNNHLGYALTWFGLALALAGIVLMAHLRERP